MQKRIHLGLDLKGGTHLILQVQVNDAVNVDSDNALERLKADMRAHKINYTEITKPDPVNNPDKIVIKGVPPESEFRLRAPSSAIVCRSTTWLRALRIPGLSP